MKTINVTRRYIANNYDCIGVGYCELQHLLNYHSPTFYTYGVYGWNFDGYLIQHNNREIVITTGYRGLIDNIKHKDTYPIAKEFDLKSRGMDREGKERLLHEFLDEILGEE